MDPYLQQAWRDVHQRLITYSADQLQRQLPRDLRARIEERIVLQAPGEARGVYPDVWVIRRPALRVREGTAAAAVADAPAEPIILSRQDEAAVETYLQIVEAGSGGRVITTLEFLSPSNKTLPGLEEFRRKQDDLIRGGVNLVEVDLVRGGGHALTVPLHLLPEEARTQYLACVYRIASPLRYEVYPLRLREPLPAIRVPLRETDEDVYLGLQTLVNLCYENGAYEDTDYTVEPEPPLVPEDAEWADALLKAAGRRPAG
jgi:hypothetical protein